MFLDEIVDRLVAQGVGVAVGNAKNILTSSSANVPTGDGPYLMIVETGGSGAALTQTDTATERPSASLTARASTYAAARAMLKAAYQALGGANGLYNVTLSGVFYVSINAQQNITDVGKDEDSRAMVVFNIRAEKQPS